MFRNSAIDPRRLLVCASAAALAAGITLVPAMAQSSQAATETAVSELLQSLVNKKVLPRKDAQEMMDRFHATMAKSTPAEAAPPPAPDAGTVRVPYISETVKEEITNHVKDKVVKQAQDEHWATPNTVPDWVSRLKISGDIRMRDEGRYFGKNNYYGFVNVGVINAGSPYDSTSSVYPPIENTTKDRNILRVRARLGIEAKVTDDWTAVIRLATGSDNSPVSTNQTLGGFYSKKSIWLDQAYIKYEPREGDAVIVGRMPNPFDHTELVWDDDINLDGVVVTGRYAFHGPFSLKAAAGAFPLDYVSDTFPTNGLSYSKVGQGGDKWLFAGQVGGSFETKRFTASLSAGFYDFENIQGKLSPACSNEAAYCLTDYTKPGFLQDGNTLFALRDLTYDNASDTSSPQYYGLASKFQVLDFVARADYAVRDGFHLILTGDYAKNLGYDAAEITALPIQNNNETCSVTVDSDHTCATAGGVKIFKSGDTAWSVQLTAGHPKIETQGDWNVSFAYAHLDPDATVDAFTSSDFHLGGTNAKGWILGTNLGLAHNVWLSARWLSADQVSGPPMAVDVLQADLNVRF